MRKSLLILCLLCLVGAGIFADAAQAALPPWFEYIIGYDGYVQRMNGAFWADTFYVISNTHPTAVMNVWFEVYDKYGKLVWEGEVWDGGHPTLTIPPNGFGWITLGMILNMVGLDTVDPFGNPGFGQKFYVRISAAHPTSSMVMVPVVEVKQVLWQNSIDLPEFMIWQPWYIRDWAEAALGGAKGATGVIWPM